MGTSQDKNNVVLITDDNQFIRFLVNRWLGQDAQIIEASNGLEVLELYKKHRPNLVLLDIHLPGKNGRDVLPELMAFDPEAFVVMLSADSQKENVIGSVHHGARAFITKPFTRETLNKYYAMSPGIVKETPLPQPPAVPADEAQAVQHS